MKRETLKKAFIASIPVMAGYLVLGCAYGILMADKGYSPLWTLFASAWIYAGSMQFVTVDLLATGASLISTALMTLLVNARHLFYGISMLEKYRDTGRYKPYLIFSLTDETYALVVNGAPEGTDGPLYYFLVSLMDQCYWVIGSVAGTLIGSALTFDTTGIDFAMTALFVTILTEQLLKKENRIPAALGLAASCICRLLFGPENFLIPSMISITALLLLYSAIARNRETEVSAS